MELQDTLIANKNGHKIVIDKNAYIIRQDISGNREVIGAGGNQTGDNIKITEDSEITIKQYIDESIGQVDEILDTINGD